LSENCRSNALVDVQHKIKYRKKDLLDHKGPYHRKEKKRASTQKNPPFSGFAWFSFQTGSVAKKEKEKEKKINTRSFTGICETVWVWDNNELEERLITVFAAG